MRRRRVIIGAAVAAVVVGGAVAGIALLGGDDGGAPELTKSSPEESVAEPVDQAFCDGVAALDEALSQAPDNPDELAAYVAASVTPAVAAVRDALPSGEVGIQVATVLDAVDQATTSGDPAAFDTPEFAGAQAAMYPYVADACDYGLIEATAGDDSFTGVPANVKAGRSVLVLHNQSTLGEYHEIALVKLVPDTDVSVEDFIAMPEGDATALIDPSSYGIGAFAAPGESTGSVVNLSAGRWVYACFVPAGTTSPDTPGDGQPHAMDGMYGEITVT
jgi:hypothetical protein